MPRKSVTGKQKTAAIYARYSSHNQRDCSIEQQVEACMKAALTSTRIIYHLPSHSLYVEELESLL